jgi:AcrR family transcriptional regulator
MTESRPSSSRPHTGRPHTGRRRNDAAREAILDATFELLRGGDTAAVTIDAIAEAAAVGRQTIYRWWPSKGAVIAEALARQGRRLAPVRDSGSVAADLTSFLTDSFVALQDPGMLHALRELAAAAQQDEHAAAVLQDFTAQRRSELRALLARGQRTGEFDAGADLDILVDMAYGVLWYRALISRAPLDSDAARRLAAQIRLAARKVQE